MLLVYYSTSSSSASASESSPSPTSATSLSSSSSSASASAFAPATVFSVKHKKCGCLGKPSPEKADFYEIISQTGRGGQSDFISLIHEYICTQKYGLISE